LIAEIDGGMLGVKIIQDKSGGMKDRLNESHLVASRFRQAFPALGGPASVCNGDGERNGGTKERLNESHLVASGWGGFSRVGADLPACVTEMEKGMVERRID